MRIPKSVKVGGMVYTVNITDVLANGMAYIGETNPEGAVINIRDGIDPNRQCSTFIHELIHAVATHLGYVEHDEKKIDELANALYAVIVDNPEMFKEEADETV